MVRGAILLLSAAAAATAGCDSPSPSFARLPATMVTLGGVTFRVRHDSAAAEAVRLGPVAGHDRRTLVTLGGRAMRLASGCTIRPGSLSGDASLMRADLDCGDPRVRRPSPPPVSLDCGLIPGLWDREDWREAHLDCTVIEG